MPFNAPLHRRPERFAVFVGPSCARELVGQYLSADFFPPASRGDLASAVRRGYDGFVLIDGYMVTRYSPSPQEVFDVLATGAPVFGASSVGALRAVELRAFGMVGVGWVYRGYLSGRLDRDDDLVSTIDPDQGDRAMSIPLVRIRYAVAMLQAKGRVSQRAGAQLIDALGADYFPRRSASRVLVHAQSIGIDDDTARELLSPAFDVKALDAIACLRVAGIATGCSRASSRIAAW